MSVQSDITRDMGFHLWEQKDLVFTVTDDDSVAVDLSAKTLRWLLLRGDTVLLEKTTDGDDVEVSGDDDNIVTVSINSPEDYDGLEAGVYSHELRDVTDELVLSYGEAWLLSAAAPDA